MKMIKVLRLLIETDNADGCCRNNYYFNFYLALKSKKRENLFKSAFAVTTS